MQKNLLLGGGEKLTSSSEIKRGPPNKKWPYQLEEVREALKIPLTTIRNNLNEIDLDAKPRNEGVFELTLHPAFLGRSYYPTAALAKSGLRDIGSKEVEIIPRTATRDERQGKLQATATLFVAGTEQDIERFSNLLFSEKLPETVRRDLVKIETVRWISSDEKIKGSMAEGNGICVFEVALHAGADEDDIVAAFAKFARKNNAIPDMERRIRVGGLTFLPVEASPEAMRKLAQFSFLRVARPMADIRIAIPQAIRHTFHSERPEMPDGPAMDSAVKAAIFDGGLGTQDLSLWSKEITYAETTNTLGELLLHGNEVTSTFLFGRSGSSAQLAHPFMSVDHYRVLGPASGKDPDLFDVLLRIKNALDTGNYRFANLSLGPRMPVDDDDVHAWTATLDQICARHSILTTVAVGNDGHIAGACRIQPPSDMVNALAVGAANSSGKKWDRAPYSCIGPGRSPGVVKPDGLAFGGSDAEPFKVFNPLLGHVVGVQGTSYAAPLTLRAAAGIFTSTTYDMSSIALKALLVHSSEKKRGGNREEIGWGRFIEEPSEIIECSPHSATIIFQGLLCKGEYRRCPIPLPDVVIAKSLKISATLCIQPHTDPEHPVNYTRAGMGVKFRPQNGLGETHTTDFFGRASQYKATEREQRDGAHKWETCLHRTKTFKDGSQIVDPVFDIEYHARQASRGIPLKSAPDVKYALVVTIEAEEVPNIYDLIRQRYPVLTPIELRAEVTIGNQIGS